MDTIKISENKMNYLKDDGTYLLDKHVQWCYDFSEGFGIVRYKDLTYNFVNSEGKQLLKQNVDNCWSFNSRVFADVKINNNWYIIDKKCNFYIYDEDKVSFKELYNEFPNMRSLLVEIIDKYTYYDVNEYFS